jgi:hypothetical protein
LIKVAVGRAGDQAASGRNRDGLPGVVGRLFSAGRRHGAEYKEEATDRHKSLGLRIVLN